MRHRQPADVGLVDDRLVERDARVLIGSPVERRVGDDRARHVAGAVAATDAVGVRLDVAVDRVAPTELTRDGRRVRIEQQLRRVAPQALVRRPLPVDAVRVALAGADARDVAVMHERRDLGQRHPGLGAARVEQAQFDPLGDLGEHGEVHASVVERGAERQRSTRPDGRPRVRRIAHARTAMVMMF